MMFDTMLLDALAGPVKTNRLMHNLLLPIGRLVRKLQKKSFEHFYRYTFRDVEAGSLIVRVPDFCGSFEIDFRAHMLQRLLQYKEFESELVPVVKTHLDPGKDVLDIGANIGLFTILFAKLIAPDRKVLAVEPTTAALQFLRRNVQRNDCQSSVIVFNGVVADREGTYPINVIPGLEEYASLGKLVHPSIRGLVGSSVEVTGDTVDHLVARHQLKPGFIKIDAEGAELLILKGALSTIREHRPVILTELMDKLLPGVAGTSESVIGLLQENRYKIVDAYNPNAQVKMPFDGEILAVPVA